MQGILIETIGLHSRDTRQRCHSIPLDSGTAARDKTAKGNPTCHRPERIRSMPPFRATRAAPVILMLAVLAGCADGGDGTAATGSTGAGYLVYATNERGGDISIIDPDTRTEIGRIPIGKRPRGLVASPDGRTLYVAVSGSPIAGPGVDADSLPPADKQADGIAVVDIARRTVVRTLRGISDPEQIAISPDGERLYVASEDTGQLVTIGRDGTLLGTLAVGGEPEGVAVSPDGATILATSEEDHSIAIVRGGAQQRVVARVVVGERPRNAVFLANDRAMVPGELDASLSIVDLARAVRIRTIALGKDDRPMGIARDPAGPVYVTTGRGKRLLRIDPAEGAAKPVTGTVEVGIRPWGLALSPDATRAFTANGSGDDVTIVDTAKMTVIGRVPTGGGPWGVIAVKTAR